MPMHPLPALLNHGVQVVLACDDPAIFGNYGLTYDFFQVSSLVSLAWLFLPGYSLLDIVPFGDA